MDGTNVLSLIQNGEIDKLLEGRSIRVLGIDLGTTNSVVSESVWDIKKSTPPRAKCLEIGQPTLEGEYTHLLLPSVVAISNGKIFVGEGAKRLRARSSEFGMKQNQDIFYECKNDIGNQRTYHRAPEGFRSAAEIAGKILGFLYQSAMENNDIQPDRVVVTVPASFQAAQRQDTLHAAKMAGLDLSGGDLLDEPVAAFLDYLITHGKEMSSLFDVPRILVVFDFGGGTCDVAVFRLHRSVDGFGQLNVESLAVSRYHRLGGGDIDAAIVHEVLIPQLCEQNNIELKDLTYEDKKILIEPTLLGLAEMLKEGLCMDIRRLISFKKYDESDKNNVIKTHPGFYTCKLKERTLTLQKPKLSAAQFEELIKLFIDKDWLVVIENEYRITCSIFAPLQDALDRAGVETEKVDFCLSVGGSSLIPQVTDMLVSFFTNGQVLSYTNRDDVNTCVARGAAYHALALSAFGKSLIQPVCQDEIAIRTAAGFIRLIPKGSRLPYPDGDSFAQTFELAVPRTVITDSCELRIEVVAASDERPILAETWTIPGPVHKGIPIRLKYRIDENQVLHLEASLKESGENENFRATAENPLTNVVNPAPKRLTIEKMEEELRTGRVSRKEIPDKMAHLAELCMEIGQREKAVDLLKRAIRSKNPPDVFLLNRLADYYGTLGDWDRQEKIYREAAAVDTWSGSWFNLSLALTRRGKLEKAAEAIFEAIRLDIQAPYLVQAALVVESIGDVSKSRELISEAMASFGPVRSLSDWELGWFVTAARTIGDDARLSAGRAEQIRRKSPTKPDIFVDGELPIQTTGLRSVSK